ncbi:response regulator transcription factor [Clostridium thermarum]|uniref:response regulator transcription factor n=1 Tax=Clostridium thermarum TaxID=1716543 RepID=UPI0013D18B19|nr:helix-turn-helix domain-containing protein [Clostridium thermarum]
MCNVLIVDDEDLICRGLKSMIERSGIQGIGEIYFTTNPLMAEEIVISSDINIILTDITMPEITGLELIKCISALNRNIKFVVLSGYDDFTYVKEAFKLGSFDYLLKPGEIEEIKTVLEKVINKINEEQKTMQRNESERYKFVEAVLENRLNKLFNNDNLQGKDLENLFKELRIDPIYENFSIGLLGFYKNKENRNIELVKEAVKGIDIGGVDKKHFRVMFFYDLNNNVVLLFNFGANVKTSLLNKYLSMLLKALEENKQISGFAAISEPTSEITGLGLCYKQAEEAMTYRLTYDLGTVIRYDEVIDKKDMDEHLIAETNKVREIISSHNSTAFSNLVDMLFSRENVQKTKIQSLERLYKKTVRRIGDSLKDISDGNLYEDIREFSSFHQLSDLRIYLKGLAFEAIGLLTGKGTEKSVSEIVKKYVKENYHKDINMAVVSNMVSLSYNHFSKIFKDEVGMNFSDYLLKVRMEKALEMLSDPVNRVQEVAEKIGYNNPKHFTRAFKKYFGFAPSEYKGGGR